MQIQRLMILTCARGIGNVFNIDMNWYFPHMKCVNLARRPDKWAECEAEFKKHNLKVERFDAIDGNTIKHNGKMMNGAVGNLVGHTRIVEEAKEKGWQSVLIFEDDVAFRDNLNELFNEWVKGVPDDWDMLYLGGNHNAQRIILAAPHVRRINDTYATHAYAIRETVYDLCLEYLYTMSDHGDVLMAEVQKRCRAYCFIPNLAWQRPQVSDVFNRHVDYKFLREDDSTPIRKK